MPTNYANYRSLAYTDKEMCPRSVTKTGTISITAGTNFAIGTGTFFLSELVEGEYIWDGADEYREIIRRDSDTELTLDHGFTNAITNAPLKIVNVRGIRIFHWWAVGGGIVNGVTRAVGENADISMRDHADKAISPFIVDGTGGKINVDILY